MNEPKYYFNPVQAYDRAKMSCSLRISIITPVYNGERFIESCIKNVIAQDYPALEHIIVDGGSTDKTVEIIKQYAQKHPHIRWVSEKDKGQSDAMNKGLGMAKAEIVGFLNVDDFYEQNVLNRISEVFKTLPEPSFLVGNCNVLNKEGKITHVNKPDYLNLVYLLFRKAPFPCNPSAYFYHKSLHREIGIYDVNDHYAMDLKFVIKAVHKARRVEYVNETWGNFREIEGTKTFTSAQSGVLNPRIKSVLRELRRELPLLEQLQINIQAFYWFKIKHKLAKIKILKRQWDRFKVYFNQSNNRC